MNNNEVTIPNLTTALAEEKREHKKLIHTFNELVAEHNKTVDKVGALLGFLQIQCGVLYTAITGDTQVENPMKEISQLLIKTEAEQDLNYFRKGMMLYIKTYMETGDPEESYAAYQLHILEGE